MQSVRLPLFAWYGDKEITIEFPDSWQVEVIESENRPVLSDKEITETFACPIGTPPISKLAQGRKDAAIIVDDISRPTPAYQVLPHIIGELKEGGIDESSIIIVIGVGTHRSPTRIDLVKKLGEDVVKKIDVLRHDIDRGLTFVGESSSGAPIWINQFVMECDLKIGLGGIYPLGAGKFGGGAKIILPGVCGADTIEKLHGDRSAMEEIAQKIGLDIIANLVVNGRREIVGLFVGDFVKAHREGARFATEAYKVPPPEDADLVVANAYPFDVTLDESAKATWPFQLTKEGCTKIFITSGPEGVGHHHRVLRGRSATKEREEIEEAEFILYSPAVGPREAYAVFPNCIFFDSWERLMERVMPMHHGKDVGVVIYPYAPIQIPEH